MARYKKKKQPDLPAVDNKSAPSNGTPSTPSESAAVAAKKPKKMASGSVALQFAGDLVLVKNLSKTPTGLFKRYTELFESLANMDKDQRTLLYRFMTALALTSHARKAQSAEEKKRLFNLKNDLFVNMANERSLRRIFEFKYLLSKNFRVIKYCDECTQKNAQDNLDKRQWKYCKNCQVDHDFYNLLSMETRFGNGIARLFISNDQIHRLKGFRIQRKLKVHNLEEEALFGKYHYNARNLDAIDLPSIEKLYKKLESLPLAIGQPSATPIKTS
jgi:hypothetical protein